MGIRTNGTITEKRAAIYSRTNGNSNKWNAEVSIWLRKNKMEPVPRKTKRNRSPGKLARHSPYAIFDSPQYCLNVFRTHHYSSCRMFRCCESISVSVFQTKCFQSSQEGYSQQRGKCLVKSSLCWELFFYYCTGSWGSLNGLVHPQTAKYDSENLESKPSFELEWSVLVLIDHPMARKRTCDSGWEVSW